MSTMTEISSLPEEVLLHLISFLPTSSLVSVWRTSRQWRDLSTRPLAARVQSSWTAAAALVTSGDLTEDVMKTLATRIQSSWSGYHAPSVAEVRCAAALAATGHLTSVENMRLRNLKLPKCEDMPILTSRVSSSGKVVLSNVTGDIGPLLSSITCTDLWIYNMKLDQAATSSLVLALQHGVKRLVLWGGVRLHIQTLVEYDGRGRCDEVKCWGNTAAPYREEITTLAKRINWRVIKYAYGPSASIVLKIERK